MERFSADDEYIENPDIDAFLREIILVCRKHGFSIGHEDHHGAFLVADYDLRFDHWIAKAQDYTGGAGDYMVARDRPGGDVELFHESDG